MEYEEQEKQLENLTRRKKLKNIFRYGGIVILLLVVIIGVYKWTKPLTQDNPGEAIPIQPDEVIKPGDPMPGIYLSNPPVSGWHYVDKAGWGVHDEELADQTLVNNLRDGGIWISYHPDAPPEVVDNLKKIVSKYESNVVLTPRAANSTLIALAAWGRLDKFDYWDEARIKKFIKAYRN